MIIFLACVKYRVYTYARNYKMDRVLQTEFGNVPNDNTINDIFEKQRFLPFIHLVIL